MKDFLQGRPQSRSVRPVQSSDPQPSHFPPITQPTPEPEPVSEPEQPPVEDIAPAAPPEPSPCATHEPLVETVPDAQGRIGHIVITCRCGEQTIVQCNY